MYLRLRLGALMKEKGISESDLNKLTAGPNGEPGVARNTIRSLSRNANRRVDFDVVERLAGALGVRPMELFEETETKPGNKRPARQRTAIAA